MNITERITYKQFIQLIIISRLIITLQYVPALNSPPANQDVWISELLFLPMILILSIPIYILGKKFPQRSIIEYSQVLVGKFGGYLVGIIYILFFLHFTTLTLSQFSFLITTAIMPETPRVFFTITMTLVCAYGVWHGFEVIARISEIVAPILLLGIILISLLLIKDVNIKVLQPIFENDLLAIINGSFTIAARTVEILGMAMIIPFLNQKKKLKLVYITSFSIISIYFIFVTIFPQMVLGIEQAKVITFPYFTTVRMVNVGGFIQHIEIIHVSIWLLGIIIKISLYYYLTMISIEQTFHLKDYKYIIIPIATIMVPLSALISPNYEELREFTSYRIFTWYALFFLLFIPVILLLLAIIRKKEKDK